MLQSTVISLIGGLLLKLFLPQQITINLQGNPSFINEIPPGHYLGISRECLQLAEAKDDAILNGLKQIFQQIGAEYRLEFEKKTSQVNDKVDIAATDTISCSAAGIIGDVTVKNLYFEKAGTKYLYYSLIYFPQSEVVRARRVIDIENAKRVEQYKLFMANAGLCQSQGNIMEALDNYNMAIEQSEKLFKGKDTNRALAQKHLQNMLSKLRIEKIVNYDQKERHYIVARVLFNNLPAANVPVAFKVVEGQGSVMPLVYSDSDGLVQSDADLKVNYQHNRIESNVAVDGARAEAVFDFSTVEPHSFVVSSPLEIQGDCFSFELKEKNGTEAVFDRYEVYMQAEYKAASFINYYIARVEDSKSVVNTFGLLSSIKVNAGESVTAKIPFNPWVRQKIKELDKWYMGSSLDYRIVLAGNNVSVDVR